MNIIAIIDDPMHNPNTPREMEEAGYEWNEAKGYWDKEARR